MYSSVGNFPTIKKMTVAHFRALMPRTHGANKSSLFAQIFNPYEVTLSKFAQKIEGLFAHVYKA